MSTRKGFPPPNKSNLYRLLKRFRSILEHNELVIRPTQSNNEEMLLKVCEKLCHRKKLCVRLLKLSGLCVMPEVMQTLHRYRHLRVYSYREYMKADGSIKQNGGVLNIAFIPPFVISDDAEEQVAIDKNSRLRAGLWKEASRFDWDSRSRILQLLFIMAAFSATLCGWIGSSHCHSPSGAIEIWKRFSSPSFCTASMSPEEPNSPQDIRQGWETAVRVIKTNVAELYHEKEKPIPPRLRRWGRQTEFAVRITDVQERTIAWFAQLVCEMCVMTHDRIAQQFGDLRGFMQPFAVQAETSFRVLMEREVGITLDRVEWKGLFSEQKVMDLLSRCQQSTDVRKQVPEYSSESGAPHSDGDEDENRDEQRNSELKSNENEEYKNGERDEVLSPISPDVDAIRIAKSNSSAERQRQKVLRTRPNEVEVDHKVVNVHHSAPEDSVGESDTDASSPIAKRHPPPSTNNGESQKPGFVDKFGPSSSAHRVHDQTTSGDPRRAAGQNETGKGRTESMMVDQSNGGEPGENILENRAVAMAPKLERNRKEFTGSQKRFGRYAGTGRERQPMEGGQQAVIGAPKKKARVLVNQSNDSGEHQFSTRWDSVHTRPRMEMEGRQIQNFGKASHAIGTIGGPNSNPPSLSEGYDFHDTRKFGKKQFLSSACSNVASNQGPTIQTGVVSESHRKRIAEKIAVQGWETYGRASEEAPKIPRSMPVDVPHSCCSAWLRNNNLICFIRS
ncbi:hypothetical protein FGB62_63g019 [Gracilaria domingensis]|nr:hypothetical protein FGB62_63g019 [Gracilaria domingensis]